ncbi:enolase C-terminal domain-like protein [Streptomyces laculatispora]|uniref:enolase C-terminal domain-like protein n=1 Tax=Streptomyces laculatispora TaxID=887464 RepID=UPI001A9513F5|nr:enolase C-terminal domain-like protein [Streptomyces laculatispora]MBO0916523.1 racemase [Streptomyces laculatispora]
MRITDVTVDLVDLPAQPAFRWRRGLPGSEGPAVGGILRIQTDEGLFGEAHTRRGKILDDLVERRIREDLLGRDPSHRELLWHRLWELDRIEEFPIYVLGLVDVALWDLAGKVAGLPVHEMLGTFREAIPAYASTATFSSVAEYLDVADQCLEAGFAAVKLHAWGDARADADLCLKLREKVGDDVPLMYDGSAAFDLADAVYLGQALSEAGYTWYEEPMREFSISAYRRLAERVCVPLLVAETSDGAHMNTADFIASGAAASVRTSAQYKAGITGAMRVAHLAESFLLRAEVHGAGIVNAHLCMAIPNTTYYESFVLTNPVVREPCVGPDGLLRAPTAPGIGYDQDGWSGGVAVPRN